MIIVIWLAIFCKLKEIWGFVFYISFWRLDLLYFILGIRMKCPYTISSDGCFSIFICNNVFC